MNIAGVKQTSGIMPVSQNNQDSHEKNIQRQITNLKEKVRDVAYDKEMSAEEKSNEKKELQERIQSLNSELKQYQLQKQQEEEVKRKEEPEKAAGNMSVNTGDAVSAADSAKEPEKDTESSNSRRDGQESDFGGAESGVLISISNTKDQLSDMMKIRRVLEGRMRTASTDEEKLDLQKRIDKVSKNMGEKMLKIADTIADNQKDEQERKDKISKIQKENEERRKNINVVVPNQGGGSAADGGTGKENFNISVSIT